MKTYITTVTPSVHHLYLLLKGELPLKFDDKIKKTAGLAVTAYGSSIEINMPRYDGYLYKIDVVGNKVHISKSEHYTDDVNSLAMEDVLTDIVTAFIGKENIEYLEPSSNQVQ